MSESVMLRHRPTRDVGSRLRRAVPFVIAAAVVLMPARGVAQVDKAQAKVNEKHLKWGPAPPVFPAGAKMAVVSGDPSIAGPYIVQLSMPDKYRVAPHYHPTDEHMKVVHGTFLVGMGDTVNLSKTKRLNVGDTITAPANVHHFAVSKGKTTVEVSGMGPFQLTYVNPNDMPKAAAPKP